MIIVIPAETEAEPVYYSMWKIVFCQLLSHFSPDPIRHQCHHKRGFLQITGHLLKPIDLPVYLKPALKFKICATSDVPYASQDITDLFYQTVAYPTTLILNILLETQFLFQHFKLIMFTSLLINLLRENNGLVLQFRLEPVCETGIKHIW